MHPESYGAVEQLLTKTGLTMEEIRQSAKEQEKVKQTVKKQPVKKEKKVVIRNTGTAMGRALAQAMGLSLIHIYPIGNHVMKEAC